MPGNILACRRSSRHRDADAIPRAASRQAYSFIAFDDFTLASVLSAANSIT